MSQRIQRMSGIVIADAPRDAEVVSRREPVDRHVDGRRRSSRRKLMRPRRGSARDLHVERRLALGQPRLGQQPIGDLESDGRTRARSGDVDSQLAEPMNQSSEMAIGLEQPAVDDAPDLVDAVAENKAAIFNRDRCRRSREK